MEMLHFRGSQLMSGSEASRTMLDDDGQCTHFYNDGERSYKESPRYEVPGNLGTVATTP